MSAKQSSKKLKSTADTKQPGSDTPASNNNVNSANPDQGRDQLSTAERIDLYLQALNNKDLSNLPQDKILEMRRRLNPYGRTIAGSDNFLNFSLTQITHEYYKKLITTAFIGFLNRMCDEWKVPTGVPVVSVYDYLDDKTKLDTPSIVTEKGNTSLAYDYEFNRQWMQKRIIVKEFLEEMFQFNPDEHVRSAYRPNYKDTSRTVLDTMAARLAVSHATAKDKQLATDKTEYDNAKGIITKKIKRVIKGKDGTTKTIIKEVPIEQPKPTPPTATNPVPLDPAKPIDTNLSSTVTNMIPPVDMFGRFKNYLTENYEEIREAVLALYCEKPEFELAINPYSWHDSREKAEAFKKQHADEVIAEVFTAETGKWNFFDSFKKQRESVNFYNKNTIILEEMVKQIERDERLGQDLMAKRVEKEKKKNIIEAGPDAENFAQWRKENPGISQLGAKHIGDMADPDMPEDSVQVDVWRIAKGGVEITKDKFFSQAEAPKFVQEAQEKSKIDSAVGGMPAREDNL